MANVPTPTVDQYAKFIADLDEQDRPTFVNQLTTTILPEEADKLRVSNEEAFAMPGSMIVTIALLGAGVPDDESKLCSKIACVGSNGIYTQTGMFEAFEVLVRKIISDEKNSEDGDPMEVARLLLNRLAIATHDGMNDNTVSTPL